VILAKRLDFRIEKEKRSLPEVGLQETSSEEKNFSFEVASEGSIEINVGLDTFREILPSGFLAILSSFAESVGFFDLFLKHFSLPMKEVSYSIMDKIATLFSSIIVGCSHIKDINHKLTPYASAASLFGMYRFPDQSQVNRFLNRMGPEQISQLSLVFEAILDKVILFKDEEKVDLNVDVTGLVVYGDKYQFAKKGYFPKQRGKEGYQLSLGTTNSEYSQILSLILDPGNISLSVRLWDTIYEVAEVLGSLERIGTVRADAIYGIGPDIAELTRHNLSFFVKGNSCFTAKRILRELAPSYDEWRRVDETTWAYLFIACATHNLISLFRKRVLSGTRIEDLGIQTIVKKLTDIPAKFEKEQQRIRIFFPAGHELARRFIQGKGG